MKLSIRGLALAGGIFWAVCLFVWTLLLALTPLTYGREILDLIATIYPVYSITVGGAFAGLIAGFLDGFIGCAIFAWLYNKFAK